MLLIVCLLTACASNPKLSNDEYKALTNREYVGVTKKQVFKAAEELLRLSDGDDFKIVKLPGSLKATRRWDEFYGILWDYGYDDWSVETQSLNDKITVSVRIIRHFQFSSNSPDRENFTVDPPTKRINGTAIYDLFWARMNYLLGKRLEWMTCEMSDNRIKQKIVWGSNAPLCQMLYIKDNRPTSPIVTESPSVFRLPLPMGK